MSIFNWFTIRERLGLVTAAQCAARAKALSLIESGDYLIGGDDCITSSLPSNLRWTVHTNGRLKLFRYGEDYRFYCGRDIARKVRRIIKADRQKRLLDSINSL